MNPPKFRSFWLPLVLAVVGACGPLGKAGLPEVAVLPAANLEAQQIQGCGAAELHDFQGRLFSDLSGVQLMGPLRVLRPGQGVTLDLVPTRLNALVDGTGVVVRLFCG